MYWSVKILIVVGIGAIFSFILILHHFTQFKESFFYWLTTFGTALKVWNIVLLSKLFGFLGRDFSLFFEIHFVTNKHDLSCLRGCLYEIFNPISLIMMKITDRIKRLFGVDTKDNKGSITVFIIILSDCFVLVLTCCIPNLHFDF